MEPAKKSIDAEQAWQLILQVSGQRAPGPMALRNAEVPALTTLPDGHWDLHCEVNSDGVSQFFDIFMPLCHPDSAGHTQVFGQIGQSLDGRIATTTGASRDINGVDGLTHLHRLRAIADAVLIGAGTARTDNPRLTVRGVDGSNPLRVLIDPRRSIPHSHPLFADEDTPTRRLVSDAPRCSHEWPTSDSEEQMTPTGIITLLREKGLRRILVEGGSRTVGQFIADGCLDRLHVMVAPMIIGSGVPAFCLPEIDTLDMALRPDTRVYHLGSDLLYDLALSQSDG